MRYLLFMVLVLWLGGCGNDKHPPVDRDDVYDPIPVYNEAEATPPYVYEKFQHMLRDAKLQYPQSETVVQADEFEGYQSAFFYCDKSEQLHFTVNKQQALPKMRSELRMLEEWQTSETPGHHWQATLKTPKPEKGITSYTWMQIHGTNDTYDFPLLRLAWVRDREGKYDHLWAIIITNAPHPSEAESQPEEAVNTYNWVDLGERPQELFDLDVTIEANRMSISLNDHLMVWKDVSYWQDVLNYFKGGVYVNRHDDAGGATVIFDRIEME
jgi:hypothetical protein